MVVASRKISNHAAPSKEQLYVFNAYSLFSAFALFMFGLLYFFVELNKTLGLIEVMISGLIVINTACLRAARDYSYAIACRVFLLCVVVLLVILLVSGGLGHTGIFWYFAFPMCAFFLTGKRQGLRWCGLLLGLTLLAIIGSYITPAMFAFSSVTLQQLLIVTAIVTVGTYIYQNSHEELVERAKENRQNLQKEKIQSDAVIDTIGEAVIVADPNGRIVLMNQAAESMFGWQLSDLRGKAFADTIPVLDTQSHSVKTEAVQPLQLSLDSASKVEMNTTFVRKNGSNFPASIVVTPIVVSDRLLGTVSTIRDITDELAVDRAKSEFVTLASHQLRTPASAIAWTSELLLSGDVGELSDEQKEYIDKIYTSNKRLLDMLDDLLTVSSLEIGDLAVTPTSANISSIVRTALKTQLKKQLAGQKLHIDESYDAALPDIYTDASAVKNIAERLLSNAIKYTPKEGTVTVSVRHSHEKLTPESDGSVLIEVTDTGYGIPKHQQTKVFTKLFRADNIKKKDTDGTGLGLYITKALVGYMGGKIWFTSEQNKGSRFSVLLPIEGTKKRS